MDIQCIIKILKVNLRHNFVVHFALAVLITLFIPVVFSIRELDADMAVRLVEMILPLMGIVIITPIFAPEHDKSIRDVVRSKKTNYILICSVRIIYSIFAAAIITFLFILLMKYSGSDVKITYFVGGLINEIFLGALGVTAAGISGNICAGYMAPFFYYILNVAGKEKMGYLYLFSMSAGSFEEKYYLFALSVILIILTFIYVSRSEKH